MRIRPILAATALAMVGSFSVPGVAAAQDLDCSDFPSHESAQRTFEAQGAYDPHRLDPDRDGIACEELLSGSAPTSAVADDEKQQDSPENQDAEDQPSSYSRSDEPRAASDGPAVAATSTATGGTADTDTGTAPRGPVEAGGGGTALDPDGTGLAALAGLGGLAVGGALLAARRWFRPRRS